MVKKLINDIHNNTRSSSIKEGINTHNEMVQELDFALRFVLDGLEDTLEELVSQGDNHFGPTTLLKKED